LNDDDYLGFILYANTWGISNLRRKYIFFDGTYHDTERKKCITLSCIKMHWQLCTVVSFLFLSVGTTVEMRLQKKMRDLKLP